MNALRGDPAVLELDYDTFTTSTGLFVGATPGSN